VSAYNTGDVSYMPDTFVVVPIDAAQAQREIGALRYAPAAP